MDLMEIADKEQTPASSEALRSTELQRLLMDRRRRWSTLGAGGATLAVAMLVAAVVCVVTMPAAVPSIGSIEIPGPVMDALVQAQPGTELAAVTSSVMAGVQPLMKVMAVVLLLVGLGNALLKQTLTPLVMGGALCLAVFTMPVLMSTMAGSDPGAPVSEPCLRSGDCFAEFQSLALKIEPADRAYMEGQYAALKGKRTAARTAWSVLRLEGSKRGFDADHLEAIRIAATGQVDPRRASERGGARATALRRATGFATLAGIGLLLALCSAALVRRIGRRVARVTALDFA